MVFDQFDADECRKLLSVSGFAPSPAAPRPTLLELVFTEFSVRISIDSTGSGLRISRISPEAAPLREYHPCPTGSWDSFYGYDLAWAFLMRDHTMEVAALQFEFSQGPDSGISKRLQVEGARTGIKVIALTPLRGGRLRPGGAP